MHEFLFFLAGAVISAPVCFGFGVNAGFNRGAQYGFKHAMEQLITPPAQVKPRPVFFLHPETLNNVARHSQQLPPRKG